MLNKSVNKSAGRKVREFAKKRRAEVLKKFTKIILDKYGAWIKAVVAWGSVVRDEFTGKSDIDVVVLVDDTREKIDPGRRKALDDFIMDVAKDLDPKMSPQPVWTITEFMSMIRNYSPLAYNILKDGIPTYDTGFFLTNKRLLELGELPITKEAVEIRMENVPKRMQRAESGKLYIIAEDLYYACLDSLQAVIMFLGRGPPNAKHAAEVGRKYLIEGGLTSEEYIKIIEDIIELRKGVEHRDIKSIKGEDLDKYIARAQKFVEEMERLLKQIETRRKKSDVQKNYEVMVKASVAALKSMNKLPAKPEELPKAFREHLIESGMISPTYSDVFEKVLKMKGLVDKEKVDDIKDRDINLTREYVRRFVSDVRRILSEKQAPDLEEAEQTPDQKQEKPSKLKKKPAKKK